jgi:3-dehydro-L-gulonate 2-dehydrogenase
MLRVPYPQLLDTLTQVLLKIGFEDQRAALCARLFAETSRDGVYSHGLNRFPLFIAMTRSGVVDIHAQPKPVSIVGAFERWDGKSGPGNLNAYHCMNRAITLAGEHGIGCVALANTNHWMRGGTYGWQAAEAGAIGICWTNTSPNLPPWGTSEPRLGNNPLVIAVPRNQAHVVLDMAVSQFSYGALASYRQRGELLPVEGGFDIEGNLTRVPAEIEVSRRPLPIGFWKGSGLALMLDIVAATLSGGNATYQIGAAAELETRLSQVFIAVDPSSGAKNVADQVIEHLHLPFASADQEARYPGERVLRVRQENMEQGVPVEPSVWNQVKEMLKSD